MQREATDKDQVMLLFAEVITLIPVKELQDKIRRRLEAEPHAIIDIINGDSLTNVPKGKASLGRFWILVALLRWLAKKAGKELSWAIEVKESWEPAGCSIPEKVLEKSVTDALAKLKPRNPIPEYPGLRVGGIVDEVVNVEVLDQVQAPEPFEKHDATLTISQAVGLASDACLDLPPEHLPKAVSYLNTLLTPHVSVHKLCLMLLKLTDPGQVASCLRAFQWPVGAEGGRLTVVLKAWLDFLASSNLNDASDSVKEKYLKDILLLLPAGAHVDWQGLACTVGMRLLAIADESSPLFSIESVKDMSGMANALAKYVLACKHISSLKSLKSVVQDLTPSPHGGEWANAIVNAFVQKSRDVSLAANGDGNSRAEITYGETVAVRLHITRGALPWVAFVTALAAHFEEDVKINPTYIPTRDGVLSSNGFTVGVSKAAWTRVSRGRDSWELWLGAGCRAQVTSLRADGQCSSQGMGFYVVAFSLVRHSLPSSSFLPSLPSSPAGIKFKRKKFSYTSVS